MPGPGPRAPCSPAPLRPLLLLLCALAPGAPGFASGGWPPRSPASARPLSPQTQGVRVWAVPPTRSPPEALLVAAKKPLCSPSSRVPASGARARVPPGVSRLGEAGPSAVSGHRGRLLTLLLRAPGLESGRQGRCRRGARLAVPPAPRLGTARGPPARGPVSRGPALPASPFPEGEGAGAEASSPPRPAGLR